MRAPAPILGLAALAACLCACAPDDGVRAPRGWRAVTEADLGPESTRAFRASERGDYLQAAGDFDGDGREDQAGFLIDEEDGSAGLFIFPASGRPVLADRLETVATMGVVRAPAGLEVPACTAADTVCPQPNVRLPHDAVVMFVTATGASFYYLEDTELREL